MGKKFMNTVLFLAVTVAAATLTAYVGKGSGNVLLYNFTFLGLMLIIYAVGLFAGLYRMDNLSRALKHGAGEITEVFQLPGRARKEEKKEASDKTLVIGELKLDCEGRRVFIGGREINLTAKEFDVLELLAKNPNKVYSRENLLNLVWGYEYPGDVRTVDVHIRRLREKIETVPSDPKYVHTKWGIGYYFQG